MKKSSETGGNRFLEWMSEPRGKQNSYEKIRNSIGILGILLPILCVAGAALSPNTDAPDWWTSISSTYYSSPILIAVLSGVSFFMITYRGYNNWDTLVNTIAGIAGFCVVFFPCDVSWLSWDTRVGLFWLHITVTEPIHFASAAVLFIMFSINSICLFSLGKNKTKNRIYRLCGWIIIAALVVSALNAVFFHIDCAVMILEIIMLWSFGFSWLVKGHKFDRWFGE